MIGAEEGPEEEEGTERMAIRFGRAAAVEAVAAERASELMLLLLGTEGREA